VLAGALLVTLAIGLGRSVWDSARDRLEWLLPVHRDGSAADPGVRRSTRPLAMLVYRTTDGHEVRTLVDEDRLGAFVAGQVRGLEVRRAALRAEARERLGHATAPVFHGMDGRAPAFVDWYLAWGTGYELLGVAAVSLASHALSPGVMGLQDAIGLDLERHIEGRYRELVLRPEQSDPALRQAYEDTLVTLHGRVLALVAEMDADFQGFLARESAILDAREATSHTRLTLDWEAQTKKLSGPDGAAVLLDPSRGLGLMAGGALAGKAVGGAAGRAVAQGLAARTAAPATVRLGSRLASPVVTRMLTATAGASAGAAGGPVGLALGGAIGLGADYLVNMATGHLQRTEVEDTVRATLSAHQQAWDRMLADSLVEGVDAWLDDVSAFLAQHSWGDQESP
jgi:hypothetical protein